MTPMRARQERFCRRFVEFGCATTAARAAGYAPRSAKNAGYRLIRHPRIAQRIAAIEAEAARLHCPSDAVLVGKLETVYRRAIVDHQFHAAARAVDLQAKLRRGAAEDRASARTHVEFEPADGPVDLPGTRLAGNGHGPVPHPAQTAGGRPAADAATTQNDDFCNRENAC
jgi:phage terminase small subunit